MRSRDRGRTMAAMQAVTTPEGAEVAVRCRGLVKRYRDVVAVDGVDLDVRAGECLGLLGPNGAGKTTTVEMIEGLTRPDEGSVAIFGRSWGRGGDHALRSRLGVQLQDVQFSERLTVVETIRLFRSFYPRGRMVEDLVALVGLEAKRRSRVRGLSGGQAQRLALACSLAGAPDLLCLDEPTTGLDPAARRHIWEIVESFRSSGGAVLLTTHYMEEATRLCDRVAFIEGGRIIALDTPEGHVRALGADQIIDLVPDGPLEPADLEDIAGVTAVERTADGLRVAAREAADVMPALLEVVGARGARLASLETHRATLEDVFIHLTGRGLRDA
ncbi:MAG: ATP-binding cassette domain-containing protein [Myxococcota bacterium]